MALQARTAVFQGLGTAMQHILQGPGQVLSHAVELTFSAIKRWNSSGSSTSCSLGARIMMSVAISCLHSSAAARSGMCAANEGSAYKNASNVGISATLASFEVLRE